MIKAKVGDVIRAFDFKPVPQGNDALSGRYCRRS
jgi:hypothetical protein